MAKYIVTVAISIDADSEDQAERGLSGALDNMTGDDILSFQVIETQLAQE